MRVEVILEGNRKGIIDNVTSIKEENDFIVIERQNGEPRLSFQKSLICYMQINTNTVKNIELKISCPILK